MQFTQLNQRHITPSVGRIILEDVHGHPVYSVLCGESPVRRAHELFCEDGIYAEQRQDEHGVWHYRWNRKRGPAQPVTETLSDYQPIPIPCCPTCGRVL